MPRLGFEVLRGMSTHSAFSSLMELARGLKSGAYTSVELTQIYLDRIARLDDKAGAYISVYGESVLLQARAADLQRSSGLPLPLLHGLPIAVKDLFEISGQITTAGSLAWKERRSSITAAVVERLQAAGMILLGKTHTVEFGFGGWGTNPLMGTPRNPWDWDGYHRTPGGSSNGSGVAVAAGLAPAAIGSDAGGSVRNPASCNGLTGLKPTFGLISLYGCVPSSENLDTVGPMTRTAEDAAILTQALAGFDGRDPNTRHRPLSAAEPMQPMPVDFFRIAVMKSGQYPWPVTDEVYHAAQEAARVFETLGARVEHVDIPLDIPELGNNLGTMIAAEAYHIHADYIEENSLPFSPWVKKRIINGKSIDANTYLEILAHRQEAITKFKDWMSSYDILLSPTAPFAACPLGEVDEKVNPLASFTRAANYLNTCAITLPAGFSAEGLPIGVQLIAKPWQENLLLQAGQAFQRITQWHLRIPSSLQ